MRSNCQLWSWKRPNRLEPWRKNPPRQAHCTGHHSRWVAVRWSGPPAKAVGHCCNPTPPCGLPSLDILTSEEKGRRPFFSSGWHPAELHGEGRTRAAVRRGSFYCSSRAQTHSPRKRYGTGALSQKQAGLLDSRAPAWCYQVPMPKAFQTCSGIRFCA